MRIFYVSAIDSAPEYSAESLLNRALHSLGHETYCVDYRTHRHDLFRRFLRAPACDAFLLQRGDFFPEALVEAVRVPRFFWDTELPDNVHDHAHLFRAGLFDHYLIWTQDILDRFGEAGLLDTSKASVLNGAFDPLFHRPDETAQKDIDVLFVGTPSPRRNHLLEHMRSEFPVVTVGAYGREMVRLFNRAKIVLNIHAHSFPIVESRVYEALGCGAFLLTERLSSDSPFRSGEHLVEFDGADEVMRKLTFYLGREDERRRIAANGRTEALSRHTYSHRASTLVALMSRYAAATRPQRSVQPTLRTVAHGLSEPLRRGREWAVMRASSLRRRVGIGRRA